MYVSSGIHVLEFFCVRTCVFRERWRQGLSICDVRSENVSQRSVYTSWEMQNKLWAKNFDEFFLFDNSI